MKKTLKVALTGGIGSGKSYALEILKKAGYHTVSCDGVYAELFEKRSFKLKLKKLFPDAVTGFFCPKADRKKISEKVFSDKSALDKLNALTHPLIVKECLSRAEKGGNGIAFIEVPLLFEGGFVRFFDKVMVIVRDKNERIASVKARSGLTEEQVLERMRAQVDYDALDLSGFTVISNDGDFKEKVLVAAKELEKD